MATTLFCITAWEGVGGGHLNRVECLRVASGKAICRIVVTSWHAAAGKHSAPRCPTLRAAASRPSRRIVRA